MECSSKIETRAMDVMLMMGFNETMDELAVVSTVCWHGYVLSREDGNVLRRALVLRLKVMERKGADEGHGRGRWRRRSMKVVLCRDHVLCHHSDFIGIDPAFLSFWGYYRIEDIGLSIGLIGL